jgi:hypothetical protein
MTENEKKAGADFVKAIKMCKQPELKEQLKQSYIEHLEGILERLTEKKSIMDKETVHVTKR